MTEQSAACEELAAYRERLRLALQAARICIFEVDIPGQRYTFFENAQAIYGKSGAQILQELEPFSGLPPEEYRQAVSDYFSHPEDHETIDAAFRAIFAGRPASYTARMKAGNTQFTWCKVDVAPIVEHKRTVRMVGVVTHLDSLVRLADQYRAEAERDSLTGLLNRYGMQDRLCAALAPEVRADWLLLLADLDNLKQVNDQYGHLQGDEALKSFAGALRAHFPEAEVIGRWGGDEFLVLLQGEPDPAWLLRRLEALLGGFSVSGVSLPVSGSFGGVYFSSQGQAIEDLFHAADQALYQAKGHKPAVCLLQADGTSRISPLPLKKE